MFCFYSKYDRLLPFRILLLPAVRNWMPWHTNQLLLLLLYAFAGNFTAKRSCTILLRNYQMLSLIIITLSNIERLIRTLVHCGCISSKCEFVIRDHSICIKNEEKSSAAIESHHNIIDNVHVLLWIFEQSGNIKCVCGKFSVIILHCLLLYQWKIPIYQLFFGPIVVPSTT